MRNRITFALGQAPVCAAFIAVFAAGPAPAEEELRDPFWPIDYGGPNIVAQPVEQQANPAGSQAQPDQSQNQATAPANENQQTVAPAQDQKQPVPKSVEWPKLKVKGVMKGPDGKYVANIEGIGVVEAGRKCKAVSQGIMFIYKIEEITEQGVKITPVEARPLAQQ